MYDIYDINFISPKRFFLCYHPIYVPTALFLGKMPSSLYSSIPFVCLFVCSIAVNYSEFSLSQHRPSIVLTVGSKSVRSGSGLAPENHLSLHHCCSLTL